VRSEPPIRSGFLISQIQPLRLREKQTAATSFLWLAQPPLTAMSRHRIAVR
jgi:hypothetical protein